MVPEIMGDVGESPDLIEDVQRLVSLHMRPIAYTPEWTDGAVRRLVEEAQEGRGPDGWYDLLALSRADLHGYLPEPIDRGLWVLNTLEARWRAIKDAERDAARREEEQPASPLDGHEIVALAGREPGPWVREAKSYLTGQVESGQLFPGDKEMARSLLQSWLVSRR
jgi:poly(A) polymerase